VLALLLAASTGAAAAAVPTGNMPQPWELDTPHTLRSGIVFGFTLGGGLAGASGYPNNSTQIGDPNYYSGSGWMGGTGETIFAMGALADYVNVGFWYGAGVFRNHDWRSVGEAGGLRVEAFPLVRLFPRLQGLGLLAQFGVGYGNLKSETPGQPESEGTQSFAAAGTFYEWAFGRVLGGHFGAGPSLEYDAIFSRPFERHGLVATARLVFYGGP